MTDYTPAEIEAAVEDEEGMRAGWGELAWQDDGYKQELNLRGGTAEAEVVESDPGGEGHGEDVSIVIRVGDQLFRKTGYYASHYGTDWDGDINEVRPVEKTVTVYRVI